MVIRLLAAASLSVLLTSPAWSEPIYRYTDEHGVEHFSNRPVDERFEPMPQPPASPVIASPQKPHENRWDDEIMAYCAECAVEPAFVKAIMKAESGFNPSARSVDGAMGLMQLMPGTATRLGVRNPYNPQQNIRGAVKYLDSLLRQFGSVSLAAAAYNAGENAVQKYGGIPPFAETKKYVKDVLRFYDDYRQGSPSDRGDQPTAGGTPPATRIVAISRPDGVTVFTNTPWIYRDR